MKTLRRKLCERSEINIIRKSGLFAEQWYKAQHTFANPADDPIKHYIEFGSAMGLPPHPLFDPTWYRHRYDDVRAAAIEPFTHYVSTGRAEGRSPNAWIDPFWYSNKGGHTAFEPLIDQEAAHPWLSRRFKAHGKVAPLRALASFVHEDLRQESVGIVELRTREFVSGWIAVSSDTAYVEIVVDGRLGAVGHFNPRPDIAVLIGRPALGFLFAFDTPLKGGEEIVVRFAGGKSLYGSPYYYAKNASQTKAREDIHVHLDSPTTEIRDRLVELAGWIRLHTDEAEIEIRVNGERHHAFFALRTDVIQQMDNPFCFGFCFPFDVAAAAAIGQRALGLEVIVDGVCVARRSIPINLRPLAAVKPRLNIFMHIPKTAGISLANAINSLSDARALWLYDRGSMAIADQLGKLSGGAFEDLRFVGGHFMHGIHERIDRPCDYFAFVRDPTSYLKSFYLYMKYVARVPAFARSDIYSLIKHRYEFDNAFTRWFAAVPAERRVEAADLAKALMTMERDFAFVGLVERMDESIARLSKLWGVNLPVLAENKTPAVAEGARIDLRELARESTANTRFDELLVARSKVLFWS